MADTSEFYKCLNAIRTGFSNYQNAAAADFKTNGFGTTEQKRKLVRLNMFTVCMQVMNSFNPTVTAHSFTASEMESWTNKINELLNESYYVDYSQYY